MKVKLCLRLVLLTGMLLILVSTFKTQPAAACSPSWYEGCRNSCLGDYKVCQTWDLYNALGFCEDDLLTCRQKCSSKLAACFAPVSGPEQ